MPIVCDHGYGLDDPIPGVDKGGGLGYMHAVYFVDDDELPVEQDFLLIDIPGGGLVFHRASAVCPKHLEDTWAAWRAITDPRRRSHLSVASAS